MRKTLIVVALCIPLSAQSLEWKVSIASLAAANAADLVTTLPIRETNPLVRNAQGRLDVTRDALLKAALVSTAAMIQRYVIRRTPKLDRLDTVINFIAAGAYGAVAWHNTRLR